MKEQRNKDIYHMYMKNKSLRKTGEYFNLTHEAIRKIVKKYKSDLLSTPTNTNTVDSHIAT